MTKYILLILSGFLSVISQAQVQTYLLNKNVLMKNQVYRVEQYPVKDSVSFFKEYPHGYYALFNEEGKLVEKNEYAYDNLGDLIQKEQKTCFFYNLEGNRIGSAKLLVDSENPLRNVSFMKMDTVSNKIQSVFFHSYGDETASVEFEEEMIDSKNSYRSDTIWLTKYYAKIPFFYFEDSTFWENLYFNKQGKVDSAQRIEPVFSKPTIENHTVKSFFNYFKDGSLKTKTEKYFDTKEKLYLVKEYHYLENGLLTSIISQYTSNKEKKEEHFVYHIRK